MHKPHWKTSTETSRNIFLVVHLLDHFVAESMRFILGPLLDPLPDIEGVDTVWVLWPLALIAPPASRALNQERLASRARGSSRHLIIDQPYGG